MNKRKVEFDPIRSILSPLWILALGILILNDHFLKAEWSNAFTGKLSDFAGLFLAPVLFAWVLGVKSKRGLYGSGLAVGLVFAGINLSPALALFWDRSLSLIFPYTTTVDPTDLIALIMIPLGIEMLGFSEVDSNKKNTYIGRALALVGIAASLASADPIDVNPAMETSRVSIYNQSNEMHILRIRSLEPNLSLDCGSISSAPQDYLHPQFFGEPIEWLLQSGQQIPIQSEGLGFCDAALIESETLPDVIVFWTYDLDIKSFPFDYDIPRSIPADPQTLVINADYPEGAEDFHEWRFRTECGSRADLCARETLMESAEIPEGTSYFWNSDSSMGALHHSKPSSLDQRRLEPVEECRAPSAEDGVFWEDDFPRGDSVWVRDIKKGIDGCHEIFVQNELSGDPSSVLICVPFDTISILKPSLETPRVLLSFNEESNASSVFLLIRAVYFADIDGNDFVTLKSIYITKGEVPREVNFEFIERPRLDCVPQLESCGVSLPLDLDIEGRLLRPGEWTIIGSVIKRELHLVRSEFLPISAEVCGTFAPNRKYLETVIITE